MSQEKILLLISESRKQPLTESLLYKQIVRFFSAEGGSASGGEEKLIDKFEIAFITINDGIVTLSHGYIVKENNNETMKQCSNLPPRFRSGRVVVSKEQIEQMADSIVEYIKTRKCEKIIAYVRGSYLEAVNRANEIIRDNNVAMKQCSNSSLSNGYIATLFSDDELAQLKKKGIMWMKVGLRMPTAFIIFRMKIRELAMENENKQLKLF